MSPSFVDLVVLSLSVCQIADTWFDGSIFKNRRKRVADVSIKFFRDLFTCRFCLSHWIAMGSCAGYLAHLRLGFPDAAYFLTAEFAVHATVAALVVLYLRNIPWFVAHTAVRGLAAACVVLAAAFVYLSQSSTLTAITISVDAIKVTAAIGYWFSWSMAATRLSLFVSDAYDKWFRTDEEELIFEIEEDPYAEEVEQDLAS